MRRVAQLLGIQASELGSRLTRSIDINLKRMIVERELPETVAGVNGIVRENEQASCMPNL